MLKIWLQRELPNIHFHVEVTFQIADFDIDLVTRIDPIIVVHILEVE